jgi:hypothetical protein
MPQAMVGLGESFFEGYSHGTISDLLLIYVDADFSQDPAVSPHTCSLVPNHPFLQR